MTTSRIGTVFHPSDFSRADQSAFDHALKIALSARAELTTLQTGAAPGSNARPLAPGALPTLIRWNVIPASANPSDLQQAGIRIRHVDAPAGDPSTEIQTYVADNKPDIVVLSTTQHGTPGAWLARALTHPITRNAHALTLFVPRRVAGFVQAESGRLSLKTVLIPVDQAPHPQVALDAAALLARSLGCPDTHFIMLHVGPESAMPRPSIPWEFAWTFEARSLSGPLIETILATAETEDADLIVMPKRGHRNFLDALRGTTTERVVRSTKCPVLAVPATA